MIHHSRPSVGIEELDAVKGVFESKYIASGIKTSEFEKKLANYLGINECLATDSGTSALHLALLALGIREKSEILLPSYVCACVLNPIYYTGAKPILADINPDSFNISLEDIRKRITKNTAAIIVPHMFGNPSDITEIREEFDVPIIEDCAQSIGARLDNKKVGTLGDISIFSFYATKMLATGKGGALATNKEEYIEKARDLINTDKREEYMVGYNYSMSDINASIGLAQLSKLESFIKKRRDIAHQYNVSFKDLNVILPAEEKGKYHVYYRYIIKLPEYWHMNSKKQLFERLYNAGIEISLTPVYKPLHKYLKLEGYSNTEKVQQQAISIPIFPDLSEIQLNKIIDKFRKIFIDIDEVKQ